MADVPILAPAANVTMGAVTAVLAGVFATMLPVEDRLNDTAALDGPEALLSVTISAVLSVIHTLPCPVAVPVAEENNDKPAPPWFTSSGEFADVPMDPFAETSDTAGPVIAVLAGVLATILPLLFVMLSSTPAVNGCCAVLFRVKVSGALELSCIHRLPMPAPVPVAAANNNKPAPPLFTST